MIRLIVFLAVAIVLALVAVWFANNPGQVVVQWQGAEVQTTVGIALIGILALSGVLALLALIFWGIVRLPAHLATSRRRARTIQGYQALSSGLIAAAAGDRKGARSHSKEAERLIGAEPAVLLLGAQSAQLEGDEESARQQFRRMLDVPEANFLGLRGLLAQAVKTSDPEALDLARSAYRKNPKTPWTATTLFNLLIRQRLWSEAVELVGPLEQLGTIDSALARRHRASLATLIAEERLAADDAREALAQGRRGFKLLPNFPPPSVVAAKAAIKLERMSDARRQVERAWQIRPHPDLAEVYASLVADEEPAARLKRFDRLRRRNPTHIETHLLIGELALAAKDYTKARMHLEQAVEQGPTQRTCRLMAELERASGSQDAVQKWENRASTAEPDHAWVSEASGDVSPRWQAFDAHGEFNRLVWTTPPRVATLLPGTPANHMIEGVAGPGVDASAEGSPHRPAA